MRPFLGKTRRFLDVIRHARQTSREDQLQYLFALGHMQHVAEGMSQESWQKVQGASESDFKQGVESLQLYSPDYVKVDGKYGPVTAKAQEERICGNPDIMDVTANRRRWSDAAKNRLTCNLTRGRIGNMSAEDSVLAIVRAIAPWVDMADVTLTLIESDMSNNPIWPIRLDGRNGVLADQILPNHNEPPTSQLRMRVDTSENWNMQFLVNVLRHELGHFFGYGHSPRQTSTMYAYSNGVTKLDDGDIELHVATYGTKPTEPPDDGEKTIITISRDIQAGSYEIEES